MTMGNTIAYYRKQLGLTQEALAQKLNVTNQAVSKWELDQACPDIQLLPPLADIFGITMDELFGRKADRNETGAAFADAGWPDDGVLRVVVYEGRKLICGGEAQKDFSVELREDVREILSAVSVNCGDVEGNVHANGNVNCGDVGGAVDAGGNINCGDVDGDVDAGASVACGDVDGDVDAGTNVVCGNVGGDVDAGANVTCEAVEGSVDAGGTVRIG